MYANKYIERCGNMIYNFSIEDRFYNEILERLDIIPYLSLFFFQHESRVKAAFEKMVEEMKSEANSEDKTKVIEEMDFKQFFHVAEFTFEILFAKDFVRLYQTRDALISILSAHSLVKKMCADAQNEAYVKQVEFVIKKCCNSTLEAFRAYEK